MPAPGHEDLRARIADGRVVVVAGSGVSAAASGGDPLCWWKGLVESGLEWAGDRMAAGQPEAGRALLRAGDSTSLMLAAELVTSALGGRQGGDFGKWLSESFKPMALKDAAVPKALGDLGVPVATTNYDDLLERATGRAWVTWLQTASVQSALQDPEDRVVLHLHGYWRAPESVIFGIRSYQELAGSAAPAVQRAMATLGSLMFVGVGDGASDPNFTALRKWLAATFPNAEHCHYRLCLNTQVEELNDQHAAAERITALGFGDDFSKLAAFLRDLAPDRPAATVPTAPAAVPAAPVTLGREQAIDDVAARLLADRPQASLLQGSPGIGKTNLTLTVLHLREVQQRFGDRRWFVRCDALVSAISLVRVLASVLGVAGAGDSWSAVMARLGEAPAVLALDSLETPWDADTLAVESVLGAIAEIPGVGLIASMRGDRPAGVRWDDPILLDPLGLEVARRVFLAIAPRRFDAPGLDKLLGDMGGIPLAIELLAFAAGGEATLEDLVERWRAERVRLLTRGKGDRPELSIAVSIDLSWSLLGASARRLLSLLGRLPDGVALNDLDALLPRRGAAAANELRRRGLVVDQGRRVRTLPPVRLHVDDEHPPEDEDWRRAARHYVKLAEAGNLAGQEGGPDALDRIAQESVNITTALTSILEGERPADAFIASGRFIHTGRFRAIEVGHVAEALIAAADRHGDRATLANAHLIVGTVAFARSELYAARDAFARAKTLFEQLKQVLGQANCVYNLGEVELEEDDYSAASTAFQRACALYADVDPPDSVLGEANCTLSLGQVALKNADAEAARRAYDDAHALYATLEDPLGQANCTKGLAEVAMLDGDLRVARHTFREAERMYERIGVMVGQAECTRRLGDIALSSGNRTAAQYAFRQAEQLYAEVGDVIGEARCVEASADIELSRGEPDAARRAYRRAEQLYRRAGKVLGQASCLQSVGELDLAGSDYEAARRAYEQAAELYERAGDLLGAANSVQSLGDVELADDDYEAARRAFERAQPLFEQVGDALGEANCILSLGEIALELEEFDRAGDAFATAQPLFEDLGDVLGQANCAQGLGDVAVARSDPQAARAAYELAFELHRSFGEPYSIGETARQLARLTEDANERRGFVARAREAWSSMQRDDLLAQLDAEFRRTAEPGPTPRNR